jgi:putative ABC transport system permease protein
VVGKVQKRKGTEKALHVLITALSLSLKNLRTKKSRTLLTAFAGSIGIIG